MSATEIAAVVLEPAAQDFAEATANPPYLFDLGPQKGRETVDEVQSRAIDRPEVEIEDRIVPGGPAGDVSVRIMRPKDTDDALPVIVYTHGAGWVFGNAHTHDRLIRELTDGTGAALVFPNYSLSPEARYPTAIEEIYAVLAWIADDGDAHGLGCGARYRRCVLQGPLQTMHAGRLTSVHRTTARRWGTARVPTGSSCWHTSSLSPCRRSGSFWGSSSPSVSTNPHPSRGCGSSPSASSLPSFGPRSWPAAR